MPTNGNEITMKILYYYGKRKNILKSNRTRFNFRAIKDIIYSRRSRRRPGDNWYYTLSNRRYQNVVALEISKNNFVMKMSLWMIWTEKIFFPGTVNRDGVCPDQCHRDTSRIDARRNLAGHQFSGLQDSKLVVVVGRHVDSDELVVENSETTAVGRLDRREVLGRRDRLEHQTAPVDQASDGRRIAGSRWLRRHVGHGGRDHGMDTKPRWNCPKSGPERRSRSVGGLEAVYQEARRLERLLATEHIRWEFKIILYVKLK